MTLLVSVVIPTYNRKESLRLTLEGLAQQTLPISHWEAVIVSDGSTDGTNEFLQDYALTAPFSLRPIVQTNAGPSSARNRGIEEAKGEIIVFIDDDVEPCREFLATHLRYHEADPSVAVIGPLLPDPARRRVEPVWIGWEHAMLEKQYSAFRTGEWGGVGPNHFYSGNASVRREHLLAVGGFDTAFTRQEDVELAQRLGRDRSVTCTFDASASAQHRPTRDWDSWLRVPYAYGRLDVIRARRGDVEWEYVQNAYRSRNRATRLLAYLVLSHPKLSAFILPFFRDIANAAYLVHCQRAAYFVLSAVYNAHYLEGAYDAMSLFERARFSIHGSLSC